MMTQSQYLEKLENNFNYKKDDVRVKYLEYLYDNMNTNHQFFNYLIEHFKKIETDDDYNADFDKLTSAIGISINTSRELMEKLAEGLNKIIQDNVQRDIKINKIVK